MTDHGVMPIETIERGTMVLAISSEAGGDRVFDDGVQSAGQDRFEPAWSEVVDTIRIENAALVDVVIIDPRGVEETFATTDEHPFLSDRGWTRADQMAPGTLVHTRTGWALVESLGFSGRRATVYNLALKGNHTLLVGDTGVWVHNCNPRKQYREIFEDLLGYKLKSTEQVHHRIPQRYRELFESTGNDVVDSIDNWVAVESTTHSRITTEWNEWARLHPNPTQTMVKEYSDFIDTKYFNQYILPR